MKKNKLLGKIAEAGYSQRKLAAELGMSPSTFSSKINGGGCFNANQVLSMCDLLNIKDDKEKIEIFLG